MKRFPSPGPEGLKVSKLAKSTIRPTSGAHAMHTTATATTATGAAARARPRAAPAEFALATMISSTAAHAAAAPPSHSSPGQLYA